MTRAKREAAAWCRGASRLPRLTQGRSACVQEPPGLAALLARRVGSEEPGDEGEREASVAGDATVGDAQEREFAVRAGLPLPSAGSQRWWAPRVTSAA